MHLIEYDNYEIRPTEEALLIAPIRKLYNKDRTKNKERFMQLMSVLYFYVDPRSSYSYITDDSKRLKEIVAQEGLPEDFKIDPMLQEAIDIYRKHTITTSYLLLQDTKIAIDKVRSFLRDINLKAVDAKGKPIYTVNSVTQAIKQIPQLSKDLIETERIVTKEIEELGRAKGGQDKTLMDDGIIL